MRKMLVMALMLTAMSFGTADLMAGEGCGCGMHKDAAKSECTCGKECKCGKGDMKNCTCGKDCKRGDKASCDYGKKK
jgi:hypothetical protein